MLEVIQKLMNSSDLEKFCNGDNPLLQKFPLHLFWKNKDGTYIGCSDGLANSLGFNTGIDLVGMSDYDLCWADSAPDFRCNDMQVISTGKPKLVFETGSLCNGETGRALSYKIPLRSQSQKITGVVGISIEIVQQDIISLLISDYANISSSSAISILDSISSYDLTKRQSECLFYLTKGMTIKQIAKKLSLSPRTVEHYLDTVKDKLGCHTLSQLISKICDK